MFVKIVFIISLLFSIDCFGLVLQQEEAIILEQFFRTMPLQSEGGFVLYNKKPESTKKLKL